MIHMESGGKGRKAIWLEPTSLAGDTEEQGDIRGSEILPEAFKLHISYPSPGV